jgi:hypothetical protein
MRPAAVGSLALVALVLVGAGSFFLLRGAAPADGPALATREAAGPAAVADGGTATIAAAPYVDPGEDDAPTSAPSLGAPTVELKPRTLRIRWSDGTAYLRGTVTAARPDDRGNEQGSFYESARTDDDGKVEIRLPTSGDVVLSVRSRGCARYQAPTFDAARTPDDVVVPVGATIYGRATLDNGLPAAGAILKVGGDVGEPLAATVGPSGEFRIRGLDPGPRTLEIVGKVASGLVLVDVRDGERTDATTVALRAPAAPILTFRRLPHAVGRAVRTDGAPLVGVPVSVAGVGVDARSGYCDTDAEGRFSTPLFGANDAPPARGRLRVTIAPQREDATTAEVDYDPAQGDADFATVVVAPKKLVRVLVLGAEDKPVKGARVTFASESPNLLGGLAGVFAASTARVTGADGRTTFEGRGVLKVTVVRRGYEIAETTLDVAAQSADAPFVVRLARGVVVLARVTGAAAQAGELESAKVKARHDGPPVDGRNLVLDGSDETESEVKDGVARFDQLRSGVPFTLVLNDGYGDVPETLLKVGALASGETRKIDLPAPPPACALEVRAVDADGVPLKAGRVALRTAVDAEDAEAFDGDGLDAFEGWGESRAGQLDDKGVVEFAGLRRSWTVVVVTTDDAGCAQRVSLSAPRTSVVVKMPAMRSVAFTVKDAAGRAVDTAAYEWKFAAADGGPISVRPEKLVAGRTEDTRIRCPRIPLRASIRVAGRKLEATLGADDARCDVVAADLGWVRYEIPKKGRGRSEAFATRFAKATPVGGGESVDLGQPITDETAGWRESPLWAGRWRIATGAVSLSDLGAPDAAGAAAIGEGLMGAGGVEVVVEPARVAEVRPPAAPPGAPPAKK